MVNRRILSFSLLAVGLAMAAGCAVPQPRGQGQYSFRQEPTTKMWYHLYLPVDYVRNNGRHPDPSVKRWPLVMTFHGMKPYDCATSQEREWEQQADIYGYIVCAPELSTSDSFMEYPLTKEHSYVLRDKRGVIAVMDHVCATTMADPKRVLSTSWSCGGYLAHYFPNRFPQRFSCIAVRLSNFSSKLMVEETVPDYRDRVPVAIFIGDGDFPACKTESEEAVAWYSSRNFHTVRGKMIDYMGHRRIPQTAAAFFAEQIGIKPMKDREIDAARTVAEVQMTDYQPPARLLAQFAPRSLPVREGALARNDASRASRTGLPPPSPTGSAQPPRRQGGAYLAVNSGKNYPAGQTPSYESTPEPKPAPAEPSPSTVAKDSSSVPPSGAGAIRAAQATPRPSNLIEPLPTTPSGPKEVRAERPAATDQSGPSAKPASPTPTDRPAVKTDAAKDRPSTPQPPAPKPADRPPTPPKEPTPVKPPARPFDPKDAGSRRYDVALAKHNAPPPSAPSAPPPVQPPAVQPPAPKPVKTQLAMDTTSTTPTMSDAMPRQSNPPGRKPVTHSPATNQPPSKSKLVTIDLSGPAVGRAPHWIGYKIADLPVSAAQSADFLWMDNGVWMSDEPRGVKILETPGRHEITVLVVAKNNEEYRGRAVVEVLEPSPSGGSRGM